VGDSGGYAALASTIAIMLLLTIVPPGLWLTQSVRRDDLLYPLHFVIVCFTYQSLQWVTFTLAEKGKSAWPAAIAMRSASGTLLVGLVL